MTQHRNHERSCGLVITIETICLIALACSTLACWSSPRPASPPSTITLYDKRHQLIARLTPDGTITDWAMHVVSRYDSSRHSMTLVGATVDVSQSVHRLGPSEIQIQVGPLGPWRVRVDADTVKADDHLFGYVDGLDGSETGMLRLGVVMCAVPVIDPPPSASTTRDAPPPPPPLPPDPTHEGSP